LQERRCRRIPRSMAHTDLPLPPEIWAATPAAAQALILAQRERIRDLEARLGQTSSNSSRPPSSDPPQGPRRPKASPTARKRGGQPGHRGAFRALLPAEQVDGVAVVVPEICRPCAEPLPEPAGRRRGRVWRHQVVELLPLAMQVTEYQMAVRRCAACGRRTRAALPAGVPRRPFGPRLTAVVALLSGRYRLSRREVRQLLGDLWTVRLSLGAVVRQEQAESAALAPVVEEVQAAVQQAATVNIDETGWRQERARAWLWTLVTSELTVFRIDRRRSGAALGALLGPAFTGVVGSDRWSAYSRFSAERRARRRFSAPQRPRCSRQVRGLNTYRRDGDRHDDEYRRGHLPSRGEWEWPLRRGNRTVAGRGAGQGNRCGLPACRGRDSCARGWIGSPATEPGRVCSA
jgi:transposase